MHIAPLIPVVKPSQFTGPQKPDTILNEHNAWVGDAIMRNITPILVASLLAATTAPALAADPLEGHWLTEGQADAHFVPCPQGFCINLVSGDFKGQSIGYMALKGPNKYEGEIRDPADNKTYTGKAKITGSTLEMQGCVLIFCQTQNWSRL